MKTLRYGLALAIAVPAVAQGDRILLVTGDVIENARVQSFDVMQLRYVARGASDAVSSDRVASIELGKFADVYKRGVANRDPELYMNAARERSVAKDEIMAQLGFVKAASLFLDYGREADAFSAVEEMARNFPTGGLVPEMYRLKFETYLSKGPNGASNAATVAGKYVHEASTGAWPQGFLLEGEFFRILAEAAGGGAKPATFQNRLRDHLAKTQGSFPGLSNRISVQLAHSLREHGDPDGAMKIYEDLIGKDSTDVNSRAGAYLGRGQVLLTRGDVNNRGIYKEALLDFLRVRLETKSSWAGLQAEALYYSMESAEKWQGEDWKYIFARCRFILTQEYPGSEWAGRAKNR